jgi:NAD(P)-dependent dehydrogenase (short-subunit alcohol dehydrogenase family)
MADIRPNKVVQTDRKKADGFHMDLKDHVVVVTGGARGIGGSIAALISERGGIPIIADLTDADETVARIRAAGGQAHGEIVDVTSSSSVETFIQRVVDRHGRIDGMVANAAFANSNQALDHSDEEWRNVMSVNLDGVFYSVRAAGRHMVRAGRGSIVVISSIAGVKAVRPELHAAYDVSKAGVAHLARVVGVEWAKAGVRVNAVGPGYTETEMLKDVGLQHPEILAKWLDDIPAGRLARPSEIAEVVCFLISGRSSAINGQLIMADLGYSSA